MKTEVALVTLMASDSVWVVGAAGHDGASLPRRDSFYNDVDLQPTECLWVPDARENPRFASNPYVTGPPGIRFYAGVPLSVNGCVVGTLCVLDPLPRQHDPEAVAHLRLAAKACEAELGERHRTNAMRQSLTASADALIDCDEEGRVTSWSSGAEQLFGFDSQTALGADITMIIPAEHRSGHLEGMRRWRASGAARLGRRLELPAQRRDGSSLDIELWMSVTHEQGRPRIHANIRDISERRSQAKELEFAKARAEQASQAKTAFLANMSHELRTPLNGVTACAGLLSTSGLSSDQRRLVDIISDAAGQLKGLIADILDLASSEAGALKLQPEPTSLAALVEEIAALCRLKADEKGVQLRVDIAPDARDPVQVDPVRLKQVLGNLLSNAVKFTDDGRVSLSLSRAGDTYTFEVCDTGVGFRAEERGLIFERFHQADATITRRFGGTGLGLAICRDLIEAMGGVLDCASTPGKGSRFWVHVDLPPAEVVTEGRSEGEREIGLVLAGRRILITDDNATNRQVTGLILGAAGVEVSFAEDGRQALAALQSGRFDLVLMDMMMPEMDGLEATRRLRHGDAGDEARHVPLIMLTANTLPDHIAQSVAAGADMHLAKPITPASLFGAIGQALTLVGRASPPSFPRLEPAKKKARRERRAEKFGDGGCPRRKKTLLPCGRIG